MMAFAENTWGVLLELAPWLLLGTVAAGLLHGLVPAGFIRGQLRGVPGVLKAVFFGVPMPLCSCGVIPAGVGLKRDGASDGAATGFLIATPQTGVDSILVSASFLGLPFAIAKVVAALVTGVAGGVLVERFGGPAKEDELAADGGDSEARDARAMLAHAIDMVRMIWRWLVFGVLISAALSTWLPTDSLASLGGHGGLLAFGAVLLASVPLYVCATASVPIAAALVAGGLPTGAALVFLMAGPATNVATLGAVWRAFGGRTLAIYLVTIITGSVAFGLGFEALVGAVASEHIHHHHDHHTWWAMASAVLLSVLFTLFLIEDLRALAMRWRMKMSDDKTVHEFSVEGMTCEGCSGRLQRVLNNDDAIESATVSLTDKRATIAGDVSPERVVQLIEGAGFDVVQVER